MKLLRTVYALLLPLATLVLAPCVGAIAPPPPADVAIVNARVIPMNVPGVLEGRTVIVRNGRIAAIGASTDLEPGPDDRIIDAAGRYLIPGLAEMHAHVPAPQEPHQPPGYVEDVLFLWVAHGVTLARGMLGHPSHLELRDRLQRHEILGPRLITSGPSFSGQSVNAIEPARARVHAQSEQGYDFLKIHPGLTRRQYDAVAEAADAAGITFAGHVPVDVGLARSLAAGQATIDHLDGYLHALVPHLEAHPAAAGSFFGIALVPHVDRDRIAEVVGETRAAGASVVPTETLMENFAAAFGDLEALDARPENDWLPPRLRAAYLQRLEAAGAMDVDADGFLALRKELIGALHRGGVPILLGADSPQIMNVPGFATHRELESMVSAGLDPFSALATGTTAPATFFDAEGRHGSIVPGADADLVLLRDNPLDDIRHTRSIDGVMVRGRWLDRALLDAGMARIRESYATP